MKKSIAIIGAGASGLVAAICSKTSNTDVTIYEKSSRIGKKILASGNGHCNITNSSISLQNYHGKYPHFAKVAVDFDAQKFFNSLGLELEHGKGTRLYPMSGQASIVVDVLSHKCESLGVNIVKDCEITLIKKDGDKFKVADNFYDSVIISAGSSAMSHIGGSESGYDLASSLGHKIEKPFASLVQLISDDEEFMKASGVKLEADLALFINGQEKMNLRGDLLFTNYGLSGSGILDLSRSVSFAHLRGSDIFIKIDLLPDLSLEKLKKLLQKRLSLKLPISLWLGGLINKNLIPPLMKAAKLEKHKAINTKSINTLAYTMKNLKINIVETKGFKKAEVMAGGVDTSELDPKTMESKLVRGLYFCGEILDIDGDCGGFNLHWAWASGSLAGKCASKG